MINLKNPVHFIALGFGAGLLPKAPGTWGTLAALPLYFALSMLSLPLYLLMTFFAFLFGIYVCGVAGDALGVDDHPSIVWDEIVGFFITMIAVPITPFTLVLGFLLFRFFDILKPWPIKSIDRHCKGGFGVMFDDLVAGLFALFCLQSLLYFL